MFSQTEKKQIAAKIEELLLSLNHPEMPDEKPEFHIHVKGATQYSWADIKPNWHFEVVPPVTNDWNENAREIMK